MPSQVIHDDLTLADGHVFHDSRGRARDLPRALAPLADTHGHLTSFHQHDPAMAICRAALAGVRLLVVPLDAVGDCGPDGKFRDAASLLDFIDTHVGVARECLVDAADNYGLVPPAFEGWDVPDLTDNVRIVAGVHPYGAGCFDDDAQARLRELLASPRCVGAGEFGLDFGPYNDVSEEDQERCFRSQLRIAHELGLPVQLHIRDAAGDSGAEAHRIAARILREEGVPEAGCDLHCFTSDRRVLQDFTALGCHIAFGGAATFSRSDDIRRAIECCRERFLLSETDSPYMAPVPLRGEECEPGMVAYTCALVADVREQAGLAPREQTYRALWENANHLFGTRWRPCPGLEA